jgi:hypothetical protein
MTTPPTLVAWLHEGPEQTGSPSFTPGRRGPPGKGQHAFPAGPVRRATALSLTLCRREKRSPCPQLSHYPASHRVSKAGARAATSAGMPPAHSIVLWRPALFGQVTLTECSTMLLHTPGLLLCYENKTKYTKREKKLGGGG